MCPKGYDPFQAFANNRIINITTHNNASRVSGKYTFRVGAEEFEFSANASLVRVHVCLVILIVASISSLLRMLY